MDTHAQHEVIGVVEVVKAIADMEVSLPHDAYLQCQDLVETLSGLARGNEWRTTPLWGVGLQKKVNGHTYFLHDGRARNFVEAIMWHGGEGEASKNKFKNMSKKERDQLIQFLWSL